MPNFKELLSKLTAGSGLVKAAIVGGVLLIGVIILFNVFNGVQKTMVDKESRLSAKYSDNQNVLSNYRATIKEAMGVAQTSTEAQNRVLEDAIKGRYTLGSTASPQGGSAFSAILEAYPNLDKVAFPYEKVQTAIFAGREAFKNQQTALLDLLRDYDKWRNSGFVHKIIVSIVGAPSGNLEARIGTDVKTGKEALTQMKLIVLTDDAKDAFDSGTDMPLDLGPSTPIPVP